MSPPVAHVPKCTCHGRDEPGMSLAIEIDASKCPAPTVQSTIAVPEMLPPPGSAPSVASSCRSVVCWVEPPPPPPPPHATSGVVSIKLMNTFRMGCLRLSTLHRTCAPDETECLAARARLAIALLL